VRTDRNSRAEKIDGRREKSLLHSIPNPPREKPPLRFFSLTCFALSTEASAVDITRRKVAISYGE